MKSGLKPRHPVKLAPNPPFRRYQHLCVQRADLHSLISEMEKNQRLQAAPWQIESLRQSLHAIELQISRSFSAVPRERVESPPIKTFPHTRGRSHHIGSA